MLIRDSGQPHLFVFSRIERSERVEFLVGLNNSRTETLGSRVATCQPAGAGFRVVFDSRNPNSSSAPTMVAGDGGAVAMSLAPLQCVVWQALAPLPPPRRPASIRFAGPAAGSTLAFVERSVYGHVIAVRQELLADVEGGDGFAEVTFTMKRASRPDQYELLGTADAPPYRVFWRPPADLAAGDELTFIATLDDLRGRRDSAAIAGMRVAPTDISFGIKGATVPVFTSEPDPEVRAVEGGDLALSVSAVGTEPLEFS